MGFAAAAFSRTSANMLGGSQNSPNAKDSWREKRMEIEIEDEALAWLIQKYEEKTNKKLDFNEIVRQYILSRFQGSPQAKDADNLELRP